MARDFEGLVDEGSAASVDGWDFGWLKGRATEERPSWGYQRLMADRLATVDSALDLQTGGGEVLAEASQLPRCMAATESWPANLLRASSLLQPRGVVVVADDGEGALPFADGSFDLVISRHPVSVRWEEIARVLRPGGTYFAQHVGPESAFELIEFFLGPLPASSYEARKPEAARRGAQEAGLEVCDLRAQRLRMAFFDVGAVVYVLRKVVWWVPDFSVEGYRDQLLRMHRLIESKGSFVAHSSRFLIEARRPTQADAFAVPPRVAAATDSAAVVDALRDET